MEQKNPRVIVCLVGIKLICEFNELSKCGTHPCPWNTCSRFYSNYANQHWFAI